jgi:hypothetical protein
MRYEQQGQFKVSRRGCRGLPAACALWAAGVSPNFPLYFLTPLSPHSGVPTKEAGGWG